MNWPYRSQTRLLWPKTASYCGRLSAPPSIRRRSSERGRRAASNGGGSRFSRCHRGFLNRPRGSETQGVTGKYGPLYRFLHEFDGLEWSATFAAIERILGFRLPASAHTYPAWWANEHRRGRHVQARAWLEAGWKARSLDLERKTVVFVCARGGSRRRRAGASATEASREGKKKAQGTALKLANELRLLDCDFVHAAVIELERGPDGCPREFMPQSRYGRAGTMRLNRNGNGPFCRLSVKGLPSTTAVYAVTIGSALAYVGKARNLARRWGPMGYGRISPRNCYEGGQSTNCKVNHNILEAAREGRQVDLWFHEALAPRLIESRLIRKLAPPWNGQRPAA